MHIFEVAFSLQGIKSSVPIQADHYEVENGILIFRTSDGGKKCMFKEWIYVLRLDSQEKKMDPMFGEELILSVKKAQMRTQASKVTK